MPNVLANAATLIARTGIFILAVAAPFATGAQPAQAQDLSGFFRAIFRPVTPVPTYQPFEYQPVPMLRRPRPKRSHPKPAPAEQTAIKPPDPSKAPGEMTNPVPALLADSTLQPGDMVMFPDGLKVFNGRPGNQHKLADFVPLSQAGRAVSRETRKLVAHLHPGENRAWSTDGFQAGSRLARNTGDVDVTGSVKRVSRRGGLSAR